MDPAKPLEPANADVIARLLQANLDERDRLTGGTTFEEGQIVNFDMGYVIKTYEHQKQDDRIRGLGEIMTNRTRSRSHK